MTDLIDMTDLIELRFSTPDKGGFYMFDANDQIAEIEFFVNGNILDIYHTGVRKKMEGKGIAAILVNTVVDYARNNHFKIIPSCSYVLSRFSRNPTEFEDVWE